MERLGEEMKPEKETAILTIGNEILCGDVQDFNGCWLTRGFYRRGVDVGILLTLPDEERLVAAHLRGLARRYEPVITTGGIGATLDDITRQAVARATNRPLELNGEAMEAMEKGRSKKLTETQKRMAHLPRGCRLIPNRLGKAPGFVVDNIFVFPGVPEMLHDMFPIVAEEFRSSPFVEKTLTTRRYESEIAGLLEELDEKFEGIRIGSYPKKDDEGYYVLIVLKSKNAELLAAAGDWLAERLPQ
jgi:molybdenum cofactor synthesis domain-containing protein